MLAVDIAAFGDRRRDEAVQLHLRAALYAILQEAFSLSNIAWRQCHVEGLGDGILVIFPPGLSAVTVLGPLIDHLRTALRRHNKLASTVAKIRLRTAVHAGHVHFDRHGVAGHALVHLFRLLDAPMFKDACGGAELGLVASDYLYDAVIRHGYGPINPSSYHPVRMSVKETQALAWIGKPA